MANQNQIKSAKKRIPLFGLWMILIVFFVHDTLYSQQVVAPTTADQLEWITDEIEQGIYWKKYRGSKLNDARLSINLIEIDLNRAQIGLKLANNQSELMKISDFAEQYQTIAAINGSFFSMETGGSVVFLKVDNELIARGAAGRNVYTENGGIGWNNDFKPMIMERPENGWEDINISNLLSSGPLLIFENTLRDFRDDAFHQNRHPRTAVGITDDNHLLLVTVDGRSFQSYGMTIPELAQFFIELGANYALNLDGGGSSAMWIHEGDGVVNYPSDNLEFDHNGERAVSNALLILRREQ